LALTRLHRPYPNPNLAVGVGRRGEWRRVRWLDEGHARLRLELRRPSWLGLVSGLGSPEPLP
jgi:hypothetical protein